MITLKSKQSKVFGDVYSVYSQLIDNFKVHFSDKQINIVGDDNKSIISFFTENNDLYYQYYKGDPVNQGQKQRLTNIEGISSELRLGQSNGISQLDANSKVPRNQLPFNIFTNQSSQLSNIIGQTGDLFIAIDTLIIYAWNSTQWAQLSSSTLPNANVNNNGYQITNLAPGTLSTDAVTLGQLDRNHFVHAYLDTDITSFSPQIGNSYIEFNIRLQQFIEPTTLVPPVFSNIQTSLDNSNPEFPFTVFSLQSGVYSINIKTLVQYQGSTQYPVKFQVYDLDTGVINYTMIEADRTDNFQQRKITNNTLILRALTTRQICLQFLIVPQFIQAIAAGTSMYIQRID